MSRLLLQEVPGSKMSRTERFIARVDGYLPTLANDAARKSFLAQQVSAWQFRAERFVMSDGKSEPCTDPTDPIQLADFTLTILALEALLAKA